MTKWLVHTRSWCTAQDDGTNQASTGSRCIIDAEKTEENISKFRVAITASHGESNFFRVDGDGVGEHEHPHLIFISRVLFSKPKYLQHLSFSGSRIKEGNAVLFLLGITTMLQKPSDILH
jgi:hypothetical protein